MIKDVEAITEFILGNKNDWIPELLVIFLLFIQINIFENSWSRFYFPKKEFFGEACYRLLLNGEFLKISTKLHFKEEALLDYFFKQVSNTSIL